MLGGGVLVGGVLGGGVRSSTTTRAQLWGDGAA
jgi:hypothetical protein